MDRTSHDGTGVYGKTYQAPSNCCIPHPPFNLICILTATTHLLSFMFASPIKCVSKKRANFGKL